MSTTLNAQQMQFEVRFWRDSIEIIENLFRTTGHVERTVLVL